MLLRPWLPVLAFAAALLPTLAMAAPDVSDSRPVVRSAVDLPPTRFKLDRAASLAFSDDAFLAATVPALRTEAERVLAGYRIEDPAIAQRLRTGLGAIAILQHRPADAGRLIAAQRSAETKPQLRALGLMLQDAVAAGQGAPAAKRCDAAAARVTALLAPADPAVVRDEVVARYSNLQTASVGYYAGAAAFMVDDEQRAQGSIGLQAGLLMAVWRVYAMELPACREPLARAFRAWLDDPSHRPTDIWAERAVDPAALAGKPPVAVAIWESGFDPSLFPGQLAIDPAEPLDGLDNDGNGVVDDTNGPTYDYHLRPTRAPLPPLSSFLAGRLGLQQAIEKGQLDLNYAADTADARFFAQRARDASVADQVEDVAASDEFMARSHATWVASLIADGAPWVQLYAANVYAFGSDPRPVPMTDDDIDRWAGLLPGLGARLRGAHVRVVNMSWKWSVEEFRDQLLLTGQETDPARATQRATARFALLDKALLAMIRACPDILFIAAAGNSDQPEEIQASVPQTYDEPNLLVVGATGANGRPTAFTTFGPHVRLYAPGEGVTVRAPGGLVMRSSGTSFAAPITARAAAAMLSADPALTPPQVIEGLLATGTAADGGLKLLHAAHAVAWAEGRR